MTDVDNKNKPLSVCFAISGRNTGGGIERHVKDLSHGLVQEGCKVSILAHESYRQLFEKTIDFREIRFDRWRFNPLLLTEFIKQIRSIKPMIVHAHGRKAAHVVSRTRHRLHSKCILTVHNLNIKADHYKKFDSVIAVSPAVANKVQHPHLQTIMNGCS